MGLGQYNVFISDTDIDTTKLSISQYRSNTISIALSI